MLDFVSTGVGYDLAIEVLAAFLLTIGGGGWALYRRAHRARELLAESVMGVMRTMHTLSDTQVGNESDEADRARYFSEFIEGQMIAELNRNEDVLSHDQSKALMSFRDSVTTFKDDHEGRQRASARYWKTFNAVVDASRGTVRSLGFLKRKTKDELNEMCHNFD
ncbi:MAG: hypothetical protein P8P99_12765 [Maricaulis sp.]|nr:hypothetical protein [Maricaulis sp.]